MFPVSGRFRRAWLRFLSGELVSVGKPLEVTRTGRGYVKVPAKLEIEFAYTGYTTKSGEGSATVDDVVWLAKGEDGRWGVVKPSLALEAASSPDVLFKAYVDAPPPDPDWSMNRAERTSWEARDYRSSFRRSIEHGPLRCGGVVVSRADRVGDAPAAAGVERVTLRVEALRICVTVDLRRAPSARLRLGFTPRSRSAFFPEYVVEVDPTRGVRDGGLTAGYRFFRGGEKLDRSRVPTISLDGSTIAFVADAGVAVPTDLTWTLTSAAGASTDDVRG